MDKSSAVAFGAFFAAQQGVAMHEVEWEWPDGSMGRAEFATLEEAEEAARVCHPACRVWIDGTFWYERQTQWVDD